MAIDPELQKKQHIIAIDCDLHKVYGYSTVWGVIDGYPFKSAGDLFQTMNALPKAELPIVLFEVSSPVSFMRGNMSGTNKVYQLAKWALFNIAEATVIATTLGLSSKIPFLVAPSNVWTHGYDLAKRHKLAKATSKKKDLRECEAMIWSYQHAPTKWIGLETYLENL